MSKPYATVIAVDRQPTGDVTIRLDVIAGKCPKWFVMRRPPKDFDSIVGTTLEVSWSGVYVNGQLWAKRLPRNAQEIVLIAKSREVVERPPDVCGTVEDCE